MALVQKSHRGSVSKTPVNAGPLFQSLTLATWSSGYIMMLANTIGWGWINIFGDKKRTGSSWTINEGFRFNVAQGLGLVNPLNGKLISPGCEVFWRVSLYLDVKESIDKDFFTSGRLQDFQLELRWSYILYGLKLSLCKNRMSLFLRI